MCKLSSQPTPPPPWAPLIFIIFVSFPWNCALRTCYPYPCCPGIRVVEKASVLIFSRWKESLVNRLRALYFFLPLKWKRNAEKITCADLHMSPVQYFKQYDVNNSITNMANQYNRFPCGYESDAGIFMQIWWILWRKFASWHNSYCSDMNMTLHGIFHIP